jgi:hypothetical protein
VRPVRLLALDRPAECLVDWNALNVSKLCTNTCRIHEEVLFKVADVRLSRPKADVDDQAAATVEPFNDPVPGDSLRLRRRGRSASPGGISCPIDQPPLPQCVPYARKRPNTL